ncbi:amidohydrolase family protein [Terrarubrum flagellatum]|uniref:amidohydrolase family protein n=1 Tax=Terrirubrum flagellatum TaxID=2895980 RepID=UPI0031450667
MIVTPELPAGACDCHVHLFGPPQSYPFDENRVYTPPDASEAQLLALHDRLGMSRVVIVQPSPYGADNRRTLDGLAALGSRARAVAVIDETISDEELRRWHALGVRGVRVNIATRSMHDPAEASRLISDQAKRVAPLGWHVQVLTTLAVIEALSDRLRTLPVKVVIDHFGLPDMHVDVRQAGFATLLKLVGEGRAFVKLSAIERLCGHGRLDLIRPFIAALVEANSENLVWGSDWPHTGGGRDKNRPVEEIEPFQAMDDADALRVLLDSVHQDLARAILVDNPSRLYEF